ncbi:hypothetical protein ACFYVR_15925 [Rhodococcus sp. NPDC003318]|uniref:hypothetical protein n=1 Tax=Rhodococcus sp. NPDC003318 TaxID=3364503 RepID=UPI00368913FA
MTQAIRAVASLICYVIAIGNVAQVSSSWKAGSWGWVAFYIAGAAALTYWGGHHFSEAVKREGS